MYEDNDFSGDISVPSDAPLGAAQQDILSNVDIDDFIDRLMDSVIDRAQELFEDYLNSPFDLFAPSPLEEEMPFWYFDEDWSGFFSIDGQGETVDMVTIGDVEFITITTIAGNNFFLIVDRSFGQNNVHFLSSVSELSLLALAQQSGELELMSEVAETFGQQPFTRAETAPPISAPQPEQGGGWNISSALVPVIIVGIVALVMGVLQIFKIRAKKRKKAAIKAAEDNAGRNDGSDDDFGY